jgi:hypothetical protein
LVVAQTKAGAANKIVQRPRENIFQRKGSCNGEGQVGYEAPFDVVLANDF